MGNDAAPREINDYVSLGSVSQTAAQNNSDQLPLPPLRSALADVTDMYTGVNGGEGMPTPSVRETDDGDATVLYSIPQRTRNEDDDEEVTVVENSAYGSY